MTFPRTFYLVAALAAVLCGCGSNPRWKHETYALNIPGDSPGSDSPTNIAALRAVSVSPLFQSRSFTYRTGENSYEEDPYAGFLVSPERALAEPIRASLRSSGIFGRVIDPGSGLIPSVVIEATVSELDGDFRDASHPVAEMTIRFIVYAAGQNGPGPVLLDKVCTGRTALAQRTAAALVAAWDQDLREILDELKSEYAKTHLNDR